jgi:hypothetical protein
MDNKVFRIIGVSLAIKILFAAVLLNGYVGHYWNTKTTTTLSTTYVDSASYVEGEQYFFEVNYYSNDLSNGEEVFEFRFNYYTDADQPGKTISQAILDEDDHTQYLKNMFSTGIQIVGTPQPTIQRVEYDSYWLKWWWFFGGNITPVANKISGFSNAYFYDTSSIGLPVEQSYISAPFGDNSQFIVDFDGQIGLIRQNGRGAIIKSHQQTDNWTEVHAYHGIYEFILHLYNSVRSLPNGYNVLQYNLTEWFHGYRLLDGKFERNNTADQNWVFANIKINRSANGMINRNQSIYGIVRGENNWEHPNQGVMQDYWKHVSVINLTNNDFTFINVGGGNFLGNLNSNAVAFLREFDDIEVRIVVNLSDPHLQGTFYGFALNPFGGLDVSRVYITSDSPAAFSLPVAMPFVAICPNVTLIIGGVQ